MRIADQNLAQRRITALTRQYYRRAPRWNHIAGIVDDTAAAAEQTDVLADIAEHSVTAMLRTLGWTGTILRSSHLAARTDIRTGRSERLADLTLATGSTHYLCGRGGMRYLDEQHFDRAGIAVSTWQPGKRKGDTLGLDELSALASLADGTVDEAR